MTIGAAGALAVAGLVILLVGLRGRYLRSQGSLRYRGLWLQAGRLYRHAWIGFISAGVGGILICVGVLLIEGIRRFLTS